jgi:hypothetical protein
LLLEKIYNTFKRKADRVSNNFRKDTFNHLRPKIMEILEAPPDEYLRSKKRKGLDEITEENEINDETVLIDKDGRIDETYDKDDGEAFRSGAHASDHDFEQMLREGVDRQGNVGSKGGFFSSEDEERRRIALLEFLKAGGDSLCSHARSSILDDREIAFQVPNMAMINISDCEESMEEQDMVFYPKEDLTQYSKPLGLNKVRKRLSDMNGLSEGDGSDDTSMNGSKLMGDHMRGTISDIGEEPNSMGNSTSMAGKGGSRRHHKRKNKKLTNDQTNRLRKVTDIYGNSAVGFGMPPRDYKIKSSERKRIKKKSNKVGNRSQLGSSFNPQETDEEARIRRFRLLSLMKPKTEAEHNIIKHKLKRFRKTDSSFALDYESPYAEYLPKLYKEWAPETKSGLNLDSSQNLDKSVKAKKLSNIYSGALRTINEDKDPKFSRNGSRLGNLLPEVKTGLSNRPKSNASQNLITAGLHISSRRVRHLSSSRYKSKTEKNKNILLKQDEFKNNYMAEDPKVKESHDALNEETKAKDNEFNIGPLLFEDDESAESYRKAEDDEEIDFRPIQFDQFFND